MLNNDKIRKAVGSQRGLAEQIFREIEYRRDGKEGIWRDTYGSGENHGHAVVGAHAKRIGLEVSKDAAANTYLTLPGKDRTLPAILIGSHLDSVPNGGNFDGAAGVVAGIVSLAAVLELGIQLERDVTVMGVRAEESVWFQVSYIGSRSALGTLPDGALHAKRIDTARSLADHIRECGGNPEAIAKGEKRLAPQDVHAFIELHIEQAPSLVELKVPIGIGAGIPGNFRYPDARVGGRYDHVGTPKRFRRDAAIAAADLALTLDELWQEHEQRGVPIAITFGRFHTDSRNHGLTTVPGEFHFSLDVRAYDQAVLSSLEANFQSEIARIEKTRNVKFFLGRKAEAGVGPMCPAITRSLKEIADQLGIPNTSLNSPASHDAAAFASLGVPVGMIFIRNENGSHNSLEAMEIDDFLAGVVVLTNWLARHAERKRGEVEADGNSVNAQ